MLFRSEYSIDAHLGVVLGAVDFAIKDSALVVERVKVGAVVALALVEELYVSAEFCKLGTVLLDNHLAFVGNGIELIFLLFCEGVDKLAYIGRDVLTFVFIGLCKETARKEAEGKD